MKQLFSALLLLMAIGTSAVHAEDKQFDHTFAVVWNFATIDRDLIDNNVATQASETLALWEKGTIENVYMNKESMFSDLKKIMNVMFFIKADTREDASKVLDEMTFVKKGIAEYQLFPVGLLWLKTKEEK